MPAESAFEPSRRRFLELARTHTLVPVYRRLTADLETPVSAFLRACAEEPECFLLESVEGGERIGRYTFMGMRPFRKVVARGRSLRIFEGKSVTEQEGDVFALLKDSLAGHSPARLAGLPPFTAGAVGFFAYDAARLIEKLPAKSADELGVPDACLMFFDEVLAFDHVRKEILLIVTADLTRQTAGAAFDQAARRLRKLEKRLAGRLPRPKRRAVAGRLALKARTPRRDYLAAVQKVKEYIAAGDVFQAVLSQRFDVVPGVDPFSIYRALRIVNPSPYLYFLRFSPQAWLRGKKKRPAAEAMHLVGSSPELLVRVSESGHIEYRPIAGTRPRGSDEEADRRLEEEMLSDEKERAEHVMLVDLGRNDVGRVSQFGSVAVEQLLFVERYSHVMHLVSKIRGELKQELTAVDAFRACFPAGTLSGAPKVRAMEIIEELEPARRGTYGGAVLYADYSGNLDSCITIRSLFLNGERGSIQAGAGIVADSVPEAEYQECRNKAQAVVRAIEQAGDMCAPLLNAKIEGVRPAPAQSRVRAIRQQQPSAAS